VRGIFNAKAQRRGGAKEEIFLFALSVEVLILGLSQLKNFASLRLCVKKSSALQNVEIHTAATAKIPRPLC